MTEDLIRIGVDTGPALVNLNKLDKSLSDTGKKAVQLENSTKKASSGIKDVGKSTDKASQKLKRGERSVDNYGRSMKKAGSAVMAFQRMVVGAAAVVGAVAFGKSAVDQFDKYEQAITDMAKVTDQKTMAINKSIMGLPANLGKATDLMKGYYQTISAGVENPVEALAFLTRASKSALAAHVDQAEMIKVLAKVMAGYDGQIRNVTEASDLLFAIEKKGQTSVAELVPVLGSVAALAKEVGASSHEMGGALALLTKTEGSTAEASTKLRALFIALIKPTKSTALVFKEAGFESGKAALANLGLVDTLKLLQEGSKKYVNGMGDVFTSQQAIIASAALSAKGFDKLTDHVQAMADGTGASNAAWERYALTLESVKNTFFATINKIMIRFGEKLAPMVKDALIELTLWFDQNSDAIVSMADHFVTLIKWTGGAVEKMWDMKEALLAVFLYFKGAAIMEAFILAWKGLAAAILMARNSMLKFNIASKGNLIGLALSGAVLAATYGYDMFVGKADAATNEIKGQGDAAAEATDQMNKLAEATQTVSGAKKDKSFFEEVDGVKATRNKRFRAKTPLQEAQEFADTLENQFSFIEDNFFKGAHHLRKEMDGAFDKWQDALEKANTLEFGKDLAATGRERNEFEFKKSIADYFKKDKDEKEDKPEDILQKQIDARAEFYETTLQAFGALATKDTKSEADKAFEATLKDQMAAMEALPKAIKEALIHGLIKQHLEDTKIEDPAVKKLEDIEARLSESQSFYNSFTSAIGNMDTLASSQLKNKADEAFQEFMVDFKSMLETKYAGQADLQKIMIKNQEAQHQEAMQQTRLMEKEKEFDNWGIFQDSIDAWKKVKESYEDVKTFFRRGRASDPTRYQLKKKEVIKEEKGKKQLEGILNKAEDSDLKLDAHTTLLKKIELVMSRVSSGVKGVKTATDRVVSNTRDLKGKGSTKTETLDLEKEQTQDSSQQNLEWVRSNKQIDALKKIWEILDKILRELQLQVVVLNHVLNELKKDKEDEKAAASAEGTAAQQAAAAGAGAAGAGGDTAVDKMSTTEAVVEAQQGSMDKLTSAQIDALKQTEDGIVNGLSNLKDAQIDAFAKDEDGELKNGLDRLTNAQIEAFGQDEQGELVNALEELTHVLVQSVFHKNEDGTLTSAFEQAETVVMPNLFGKDDYGDVISAIDNLRYATIEAWDRTGEKNALGQLNEAIITDLFNADDKSALHNLTTATINIPKDGKVVIENAVVYDESKSKKDKKSDDEGGGLFSLFARGGNTGAQLGGPGGLTSGVTTIMAGEEAPEWIVPTNHRNQAFKDRHGAGEGAIAQGIINSLNGSSPVQNDFLKTVGADPGEIARRLKMVRFAEGGNTAYFKDGDLTKAEKEALALEEREKDAKAITRLVEKIYNFNNFSALGKSKQGVTSGLHFGLDYDFDNYGDGQAISLAAVKTMKRLKRATRSHMISKKTPFGRVDSYDFEPFLKAHTPPKKEDRQLIHSLWSLAATFGSFGQFDKAKKFASGGATLGGSGGITAGITTLVAGEEAPEWIVPTDHRNKAFQQKYGSGEGNIASSIIASLRGGSVRSNSFLESVGADPRKIASMISGRTQYFASGGYTGRAASTAYFKTGDPETIPVDNDTANKIKDASDNMLNASNKQLKNSEDDGDSLDNLSDDIKQYNDQQEINERKQNQSMGGMLDAMKATGDAILEAAAAIIEFIRNIEVYSRMISRLPEVIEEFFDGFWLRFQTLFESFFINLESMWGTFTSELLAVGPGAGDIAEAIYNGILYVFGQDFTPGKTKDQIEEETKTRGEMRKFGEHREQWSGAKWIQEIQIRKRAIADIETAAREERLTGATRWDWETKRDDLAEVYFSEEGYSNKEKNKDKWEDMQKRAEQLITKEYEDDGWDVYNELLREMLSMNREALKLTNEELNLLKSIHKTLEATLEQMIYGDLNPLLKTQGPGVTLQTKYQEKRDELGQTMDMRALITTFYEEVDSRNDQGETIKDGTTGFFSAADESKYGAAFRAVMTEAAANVFYNDDERSAFSRMSGRNLQTLSFADIGEAFNQGIISTSAVNEALSEYTSAATAYLQKSQEEIGNNQQYRDIYDAIKLEIEAFMGRTEGSWQRYAAGGITGAQLGSSGGLTAGVTTIMAGEEDPEWIVPTNHRNAAFLSRYGANEQNIAHAIALAQKGYPVQGNQFLRDVGADPVKIAGYLGNTKKFAAGGYTGGGLANLVQGREDYFKSMSPEPTVGAEENDPIDFMMALVEAMVKFLRETFNRLWQELMNWWKQKGVEMFHEMIAKFQAIFLAPIEDFVQSTMLPFANAINEHIMPAFVILEKSIGFIVDAMEDFTDFVDDLTGGGGGGAAGDWFSAAVGAVSSGFGSWSDGGIARGPSSGHYELLHGDEAVIPLRNGSVPVDITQRSATNRFETSYMKMAYSAPRTPVPVVIEGSTHTATPNAPENDGSDLKTVIRLLEQILEKEGDFSVAVKAVVDPDEIRELADEVVTDRNERGYTTERMIQNVSA